MLSRLSNTPPIYPSSVHGKLEKKNTFGRAPVGTGPYKVTRVDTKRGVVFERNEDYARRGMAKPAGKIRRIEISSIPDNQTQVAKLLAGELDLVYNVGKDLGESLKADPRMELSTQRTVSFTYFYFDVADRLRHRRLQGQAGAQGADARGRPHGIGEGVPARVDARRHAAARHVPPLAHRVRFLGRAAQARPGAGQEVARGGRSRRRLRPGADHVGSIDQDRRSGRRAASARRYPGQGGRRDHRRVREEARPGQGADLRQPMGQRCRAAPTSTPP